VGRAARTSRLCAVFALARVKQDLLAWLRAFGLADKIGPEFLSPTLPTAVEERWAGQRDPRSGGDGSGRSTGPGDGKPGG